MYLPENLRPEFIQLAALEPRLNDLEKLAVKLAKTTPANQRLRVFYAYLKPEVCRLAGWERRASSGALATGEAYDTVYQHALNILESPTYREAVISELAH